MTDKEFLKQLGLRLKCQRIMVELSTQQVSEKTGINTATINRIEKGLNNSYLLNIRKLATVYGIDIKNIF